MINVLTIGVSFALLKYDKKLVEDAIKATFHEKIADMNITAVDYAYDYAEKNFNVNNFKYKLEKQDANEPRIFLTGNQAVAMGKVLGGCRVQTYYPITPAADESEYLEAHEILKTKKRPRSHNRASNRRRNRSHKLRFRRMLNRRTGSNKHLWTRLFFDG